MFEICFIIFNVVGRPNNIICSVSETKDYLQQFFLNSIDEHTFFQFLKTYWEISYSRSTTIYLNWWILAPVSCDKLCNAQSSHQKIYLKRYIQKQYRSDKSKWNSENCPSNPQESRKKKKRKKNEDREQIENKKRADLNPNVLIIVNVNSLISVAKKQIGRTD